LGAFYTFGITFSNLEYAERCKLQFQDFEIKLNDSSEVKSNIYINNCDYKIEETQQYICAIFPTGLGTNEINLKFFEAKNFYHIRDCFYKFLFELNLPFNFAFFEFEGADFLQDFNPIEELQNADLSEIGNGELVGYFQGQYNPEEFLPKRFLDGLVISSSVYTISNLKIEELQPFKNGYLWLSL
jgi:hypothetical protein